MESEVQCYIHQYSNLETRRLTISTLSSVYACSYVFLVPFVNACLNQRNLSHSQITIQASDKRNFGNILHSHHGIISVVLILVCFLTERLVFVLELCRFPDVVTQFESWKAMGLFITS